jgi:CheY-like chemotaxis protein
VAGVTIEPPSANGAITQKLEVVDQPVTGSDIVGSLEIPADAWISPSEASNQAAFLLVDDNAINLKILESYMKKVGQEYETAMNGQEALGCFRQNPRRYRCIFMDISMPIMDGLEATRLIRAFESEHGLSPPVFVIALTGLASSNTQQEAFGSGIDLFLTKPVPLKELGRILKENNL